MASLDDFNPVQGSTLDDFQIEGPLVRANSKPSNINLAAHTAALTQDPDSIEATYLQIAGELDEEGDSRMARDISERARERVRTSERKALTGILTDPNLSDEEKHAAANAYLDEESSLYNIRNIVAAESLIAPSGDETFESHNARINFAETIEEVNAIHREQQAYLNRELDSQDPHMLELSAGFLEIIVPYMEQTITGDVLSKIRDGDKGAFREAFTLMGNAKVEMQDILRRMPHEERMQVVEKVVEAINTSPSIVAEDANAFARIDFLRTALEEGYYGNVDRLIDNTVSLIDLSIPLVGPLVTRVSRARAAARFARDQSRFLDTPGLIRSATYTPVDQQAAGAAVPRAGREPDALSAAEDASETALAARRDAFEADPVRRAEGAAERRAEARRAFHDDSDELRRLEDAEEQAAFTRRTGGHAARMTDSELRFAEDAAEYAARTRYVKSEVQPLSLSQVYRNTNPQKARVAFELAATDTTGHSARAMYGSSRLEAVAHDVMPEIPQMGGRARNKVSMPDGQPVPGRANPRVMDVMDRDGAIHLTDSEKIATATRVINDFNHVAGLTARTEMTLPAARDIGGRLNIRMTYGPKDNGWSSAPDALEKVKQSLRHYGVTDEDLTLLARQGDEYVPIRLQDAIDEQGDYLVQLDFPFTFNANDLRPQDWNDLDVMWNYLDRIPHFRGGKSGSIQRHILDAHSMLHPNITLGANVAIDRAAQVEKTLIQLSESFSSKYNALPDVAQAAVEREIKRANREGRNKNRIELRADGFGDQEISALESWREVWDTMYWLENQDLVRTLRNRGYGVLEDSSTDTRLFVKELHRNRAGSHRRAYDPQTGEMRNLNDQELTDLYNSGGSIATLRSPLIVGDEAAEAVISANTPGGPYTRRLRDNDQILNYREGYYTVYYRDPKFIDKIVKDSRGNVLKRGAVATAADTPTARRFQKRFQDEDNELNVEYVVRDSRERLRTDSDDHWSIQEAGGRTAQRVRGERLEDATSPITDEAHNHILGPVDSLIESARNLSARVPVRNYLEATKTRAMNQYGHMFPKDQYGRTQFPSSSKDIRADLAFGKEAADARTVVEYINTLEQGYINAIDDGIKYFLRVMADGAGNARVGIAERALNFASKIGGPTRLGKNTAFTLYLALNPLRQFIVQGHQALQLMALHPRYAATRMVGDMSAIIERKASGKFTRFSEMMTGRSADELEEMFRAYEASGLSASIDKSNLVRNTLSEIADTTSAGGFRRSVAQRGLGKVAQGIALSRKAGFDMGEEINMLSSWLTHYDLARRQRGNTNFTHSEFDTITARARDYTYNMNRAGEMPYNQNALGMLFQFMQVPHKALLQMTTNRNLTRAQKSRLAAFNLAVYGGPPGTLLTHYVSDFLPEDGEWREAVLQGLEGYTLNKLASLMFGEDVSIDYSSISAVDQTGLLEFITQLWTTDLGEMLAASPAGALFAGSNPRVTRFARTAAEYFNFVEDPDLNPVSHSEFAQSFLGMASGFSNAFRAKYALEYGKKINASGGITDPNVNTVEAIAAGLGLGTLDEARRRWVSTEVYEQSQAYEEDVKEWYRLVKMNLAREGITNDEFEFQKRVLNSVAEQFRGQTRAKEIIHQQLAFDIQDGDLSLHNSILRSFEWLDPQYSKTLVDTVPGLSDEQRQQYRDQLEFIEQYREEN